MIAVAPRRGSRMSAGLFDGLIVDLFAGGGGASVGMEAALGRSVDVAVNHDPVAVSMHATNHPHTRHIQTDVFEVEPIEATGGRCVDLLWASPDCTYHSKARGAKPIRSKHAKRRALAWVVVKWAARVRPRVIMLENVEEFADWCPLVPKLDANGRPVRDADGCVLMRPCQRRKGATFRRWVRELRALGYAVEWRELRACDYGSPTIRKRLYVIARCDGQPIVWPERTHGQSEHRQGVDGGPKPRRFRTGDFAVEHVAGNNEHYNAPRARADSSVGASTGTATVRHGSARQHPSVQPFRTAAECIDWWRPCPSIFLTREEARALGLKVQRPLKLATMKRIARGVKKYVLDTASPFIVVCNHGGDEFRGQSVREPMGTVTAARDARGVVVPFTVPRYGERDGQAPRCGSVDRPAPTIVPSGNGAQVCAAYLAQHNGARVDVNPGRSIDAPLSTIACTGSHQQVVACSVVTNTTGHAGAAADAPLPTVTTGGHHAVAAAFLSHQRGDPSRGCGSDPAQPVPTITANGNHAALVYAFLASYYGVGIGQDARDPMRTIPTHERFAVVQVDGVERVIEDIGMRMLTPRELYRCQGFGDEYVIDAGPEGRRLTKAEQTRLVGNSVCPQVATALVLANVAMSPTWRQSSGAARGKAVARG